MIRAPVVSARGMVMVCGTLAAVLLLGCKDPTAPSTTAVSPLAAGNWHTCALTATGTAYCWGANYSGQLGTGSTINGLTPLAVSGNLSFAAVVAAGGNTCGLTGAGAAYCWGDNSYGQLGDGSTTTPRLIPTAVSGGLTFGALAVGGSFAVGNVTFAYSTHTCGLTVTGTGYCWGDNDRGQLGTGSTAPSLTPLAVSGGMPLSAIAAGPAHSCGVSAAGAAYCWGANGYGQLGDGSTATPRLVPTAVSGGLTVRSLAAGGYRCTGGTCPPGYTSHTCALTSNGTAYCWGSNSYGQLGDGSTTNDSTPVPVSGGLRFQALAAGTDHTCGLTTSGAAYCWGWNFYGQLGDGSTTTSSTPVAVSGGLSFSALAAGLIHTCGRTTAGGLYCWGDNGYGQLGNGSTTSTSIPVAVSGWPPP